MTNHYNPKIHHRRSIRLKGYDYTQAGAYFITVVTRERECLLGEVADGAMMLNDAGRMIQSVWEAMPHHYHGVATDAFVVMPNHIHGIVFLVGAGPRACPDFDLGLDPDVDPDLGQRRGIGQPPGQPQEGQPRGVAPTVSLGDVVHRFKTLTTKRYVDGVKQRGWRSFPGKLWQRNYYDHIIRDEVSLNHIREYIVDNPTRWAEDPENPALQSRKGADA